ncbi:FMN-binding negative transcriptional regulator [Pseudohoeflea suaedae]|uniref:FMN-binding negative transcriptional regulator n=1 Tax=Pseudohoeflea suaedae TaxID=877384 RepID=A0A4R5PPI1_9HYPH|nr:FMN-binding negative transcriptional regulator [Pseudohoeflea suaedae]TDH39000.1 FMN-binding negative transcriptional regulator [Pseudohoeflea suaedae]
MYLPEHFAENRPEEIDRLIDAYPLATIVAQTEAGLAASHIPLLREGTDRLIGHVALANDMHRDIGEDTQVLAIFRAEHAYISPNWYPSKLENHKSVPTWNYQAVHVKGRIRFDHSEKFKRMIVGRMTKHFEAVTSGDKAWRMADAPRDYMEMMLGNIVGLDMTIERVIAKSKLSQNRTQGDHDSVVRQLDERGDGALANAMRNVER